MARISELRQHQALHSLSRHFPCQAGLIPRASAWIIRLGPNCPCSSDLGTRQAQLRPEVYLHSRSAMSTLRRTPLALSANSQIEPITTSVSITQGATRRMKRPWITLVAQLRSISRVRWALILLHVGF